MRALIYPQSLSRNIHTHHKCDYQEPGGGIKALAMPWGSCGEGSKAGQSREDASDRSAKGKESSSHRVILEKAPYAADSEK